MFFCIFGKSGRRDVPSAPGTFPVVYLLGILLGVVFGGAHAGAAVISGAEQEQPKLHVSGEAALEFPADQLEMSVAVVTENEDAKAAMNENSRRVASVIEALKGRGLNDKEYQTGRFSIEPRYTQRPKNAPVDWTPRIAGYRVENMLHVRTTKMELIGDLIKDAVGAGANSIPSIGFGLADLRAHRGEAIREATRNAIADATALAEAAGVRLAGVFSLQLDDMPVVPQGIRSGRMVMQLAEAAPPPIEPGDVTVRARVTVVYRLEPR